MDHLSLTVLPLESSLDGNERNIEEIAGNTRGLEIVWEGRLSAILWTFSREKHILGVLEMPGTLQQPK